MSDDFVTDLLADFANRVRGGEPLPAVHKAFGARPVGYVPRELDPADAPEINEGELDIARALLLRAAKDAFAMVKRGRGSNHARRQDLFFAFRNAVEAECERIGKAVKVQAKLANIAEELKAKRAEHRRQLAKELKGARARLAELLRAIEGTEALTRKVVEEGRRELRREWAGRLAKTRARYATMKANHEKWFRGISDQMALALPALDPGAYPAVCSDMIKPDPDGLGLPPGPGIYFLWLNGSVDYVGQSIRLCERVRLGVHHVLRAEHGISFVLIPRRELTWAECYYIGTLRPPKNFGVMASHAREDARRGRASI